MAKCRKMCKSCPYIKGEPDNFEILNTEAYMYDGEAVHSCHVLTDYHTKELPNSECIGSILFGRKLKGEEFEGSEQIKDLIEMERQ